MIDLTAEPLVSAGLFAITGPTGSGKSTILDAVTLALFGKAARYGNDIPEDMMTRQCGECSAEVTFEVPSGRYRAEWHLHRARKKASGNLQGAKRYIYNDRNEPLTQQIRDTDAKIEEILGLNFDRFLRSVLLAQGEFARFLKAKSNERAELLESLTGTVIYSILGKKAYDEYRQRENALELQQGLLGQLVLLTEEEVTELTSNWKESQNRIQMLDKELAHSEEMLRQIDAYEKARAKELLTKKEMERLYSLREKSLTDFESLRKHQQTIPFSADIAAMGIASERLNKAEADLRTSQEVLEKTGLKYREKHQKLYEVYQGALNYYQFKLKEWEEKELYQKKLLDDTNAWLEDHKGESILQESLNKIVAALSEMKSQRAHGQQSWRSWKQKAEKTFLNLSTGWPNKIDDLQPTEWEEECHRFFKKVENEIGSAADQVRDAEKRVRLSDDHLRKSKLVADLSVHRSSLVDGEACPLCGALEHPYAGDICDAVEIQELADELRKAEKDLIAKRRQQEVFQDQHSFLMTEFPLLQESLLKYREKKIECQNLLETIGEELPKSGQEQALIDGLQRREAQYRTCLKNRDTHAAELKQIGTAQERAVEDQKKILQKFQKMEAPENASIAEGVHYNTLPNIELLEDEFLHAKENQNAAKTSLKNRQEVFETSGLEYRQVKQALETKIAESEFSSWQTLIEARLDEKEVARIERVKEQLNKEITQCETLYKQIHEELTDYLRKNVLQDEEAEAFKKAHWEKKQSRDDILRKSTELKSQLDQNQKNKSLKEEKEKQFAQQQKELEVWRKLKDLIGSYDGAKFRKYAQTISLDILVRHANRHLSLLNDRYLILRTEKSEELELEIEDLHQANVKRPMSSLSGGESFLVSLGLALGLSDLAGRSVRIDSLFIDEGFGSLDPETLEIAIDALESLRQKNKTVGIISHVGLLKERISTQIIVEKQSGGHSQIRIEPMGKM